MSSIPTLGSLNDLQLPQQVQPSGPAAQQQQPPQQTTQPGPVKQGLRGLLMQMMHNIAAGGLPGAAYPGDLIGEAHDERQARIAQTQAQAALTQAQADVMKNTVPFQLPNGATVHLPTKMATDLMKQQLANQGKTDVAGINKRYMSVPNVGLIDTQAQGGPSLVPGSSQGITLNEDHLKQLGLPQQFLGKNVTPSQWAQLERGESFQNVFAQTASGPVIVPKSGPNMGKATPVTLNGQNIMSNPQAGAYWQARYGVVKTVDPDGNPMYVSRINAPGAPTDNSSFQILKGKAGLDNYKGALDRIGQSMDVLNDPTQRSLIAQTLKNIGSNHDDGFIRANIANMVSSGLNDKAADLVAATLNAREWVSANRSFAGNMMGSEALYNRMASNQASPSNSIELNRRLIQQDMANTSNVETRIKAFQSGHKATPQAPAHTGGFNPSNYPKAQ